MRIKGWQGKGNKREKGRWRVNFVYIKHKMFNFISHVLLFTWCGACRTCGIFFPRPGVEPTPSVVKVQSHNHLTSREVQFLFTLYIKLILIWKITLYMLTVNPSCDGHAANLLHLRITSFKLTYSLYCLEPNMNFHVSLVVKSVILKIRTSGFISWKERSF